MFPARQAIPQALKRKRLFETFLELTVENRARFKFGKVSETKPGFARVVFADLDNMETEFLPLLLSQTLENRQIHTIDAGSLVAVLMDDHLEDGVILGAIYSAKNPPEQVENTIAKFKARDGGFISYNTANGELLIETKGLTQIKAAGDIQIETAGNLKAEVAANATLNAQGSATITAAASVSVNAPKIVLNAASVEITGILAVNGKGRGGAKTGSITGDIHVDGSITASGNILAGGSNSNHHSH